MRLIGTKFFTHDSAVCLIDTEKREITALSTERLTRIKHDDIDCTLAVKSLNVSGVDAVAHAYSDFNAPLGETGASWIQIIRNEVSILRRRLYQPKYLKDLLSAGGVKDLRTYVQHPASSAYLAALRLVNKWGPRDWSSLNRFSLSRYIRHKLESAGLKFKELHFFDHHLCHAVSGAALAPFGGKDHLNITLDGYGDGYFSKVFWVEAEEFHVLGASQSAYHEGRVMSLGELYGDVTVAAGYHRNADEGKVEALAAFGQQNEVLRSALDSAIWVEDGAWKISVEKYSRITVDYLKSEITSLGVEAVAATVQRKLEDDMVAVVDHWTRVYPNAKLVLSGGVAANIIMSLAIYERCSIGQLFVCPPMSDDGLALGAAVLLAKHYSQDVSWIREQTMPYFGTVVDGIDASAVKFNVREVGVSDWHTDCAEVIASGGVVGVVQGRMEYGPRALGNRSILANPLLPHTRDRINSTVKRRPMFQPFCPSILESERERLFESSFAHKHMAIAFRMKSEFYSELPCAVHVDGTARPQFVEESDNPGLFKILTAFKQKTGYGVLINTSFNLHGRTNVQSADDVFTDFLDCQLDAVYINGRKFVRREEV